MATTTGRTKMTTKEKIELHRKLIYVHTKDGTRLHSMAACAHRAAVDHQETGGKRGQPGCQKSPDDSSAMAHELSARAFGVSPAEWRKTKMYEVLGE
jgi:hypothetical protein